MNVVHIELPAALDPDLAAEIAKQAVHASRTVRAFRWGHELRTARIEVEVSDGAAEAEDKVRRMIASMVARHRAQPRKVLCSNTRKDTRPLFADIERELAERGFLRELGPGQIALSGPPLAFARAFDARLATLARERFGAREEAYPALIPADTLHRCGYVRSFPHAVSMVTHLVEDLDAIDRFRSANAAALGFAVPEPGALAHPSACLSPTVCHHLYPTLEGKRLAAPLMAVTASGRCFRYESRNVRGLERLWDFEMREIIFAGAGARVAAMRKDLIEMAASEAKELDLDFVIESATDPFFCADHAQKAFWQARGELKFELRLAVPPRDGGPRAVAAASFNLHEDFFGRTFAFTTEDGAAAFTGCAGWGIARWILGAFAQHGLSPARWPASWRREVFA